MQTQTIFLADMREGFVGNQRTGVQSMINQENQAATRLETASHPPLAAAHIRLPTSLSRFDVSSPLFPRIRSSQDRFLFFSLFFAIHKQCSSHSSSNARLTRHTKRLVQSLHMFRNQLVRATPQSARSSLHVLNACSGHTARKCRSCQLSTVFTCHAFPLTVLLSHRHSPQQTPPLFSFAFPPLNVPISNVRDVCPVCHVFSLDTYQSYPPHLSL